MPSMNTENKDADYPERESGDLRHIYKPLWMSGLESRLAQSLPAHPKTISSIKLVVITPLIFISLSYLERSGASRSWIVFFLFLMFVLLDYLSGIVARAGGKEKSFGRVLDRVADFPLVVILAYFSLGILPIFLLALKVLIDLLLLVLYLMGRGSPENRFRTSINYSTFLAMLFVTQGVGHKLINPEHVSALLAANIVFFSITAFYNLNVIQKRFIADSLSGANLLCGVLSMVYAVKGRLDISLVFLMLGAAFDGFDGAAARKWGGTRWGVYSDDVADAVNYGIAPGFALWLIMPGLEGWVLGPFFTIFTLSRLAFFTLNKSESDPNYFCGVPSTLGGLVTLCSLILFKNYPALVGLMVGVACVQMVSFDTLYRHLGRAMAENRRVFFGMPFLLVLLIGGQRLYGVSAPVAMILIACLGYAFKPTIQHLVRVATKSASV